ncbi:High-affnity carbon uptake protein Hat/HatR [Enhygromyxa salina]|uniref:High-affnity carbon uptake protein Hat/HatR n=1 Tax=Enhygromyxa salina TaxID=215803 RepID=A0A0C2CZT1_9BACT|nr:serine/threonine-protein kinase [Enhygromyxa salina]KIG15120.1 High-affnity carbon uptake protein Hat/HatR [Enhygromyxa salina]
MDRSNPSASTPELGQAPAVDELDLQAAQRRVLERMLGRAPQPARVDRFVLDRKLGSGGMGTVWRAHDEQLNRAIALKFLRSERAGALAERRMFEEAQALAKISHPNVIPVYDVGRHEGRVWIAMELIPGRSLREWVREAKPSVAQILAAWRDAGQGLAAVHARGLIHRDVKPDNVMIGDDGRVRVIDFGLVRGTEGSTSDGGGTTEVEPAGDEPLTATGQFLGTRSYAAPEQLAGGAVDARADQYAFCVSVWESLCDERPAPAEHGVRWVAPAGVRISRRVHRALQRGLAVDPAQRFASMTELLAALAPPRRRWLVPAAWVVALVGVGVGASGLRSERVQAVAPCSAAAAGLDAVLDASARARYLAVFNADTRGFATTMLDDWSERWRGAATQSCVDVHVAHVRSDQSLDRRRACLDASLAQLEVVLAAVERSPAPGVDAVEWFGALDDPRACLDAVILTRRGATLSPARAQAANDLRARLFAVWIGSDEPALGVRRPEAARLSQDAARLGSPELEAFAMKVLAHLAYLDDDAESATRDYGRMLDLADQLDREDLRAAAWHGMAAVALDLDLDVELATWRTDRERRSAERAVGAPRERGLARISQARLQDIQGRSGAARSDYQAALSLLREAGAATSSTQALVLRSLGKIAADQGRKDDAAAAHAQAARLELGLETGAPSSARTVRGADGQQAFDRAWTHYAAGELGTAEQAFVEARAAWEAERGPASLRVADCDVALAGIYDGLGDSARARDHAQRADRRYREQAAAHPDRFYALSALGTIEFRAGRLEASRAAFELALDILERQAHADPTHVALTRANLGEALAALGRHAQAQPMLEAAIESLEREQGPNDISLAIPRKALGATLLARDRLDQAQTLLELALAQFDAGLDNPVEAAETRWLLALTLDARGDRGQAIERATEAARAYDGFDGSHQPRRDEIQQWLRDRNSK